MKSIPVIEEYCMGSMEDTLKPNCKNLNLLGRKKNQIFPLLGQFCEKIPSFDQTKI
jgi:hypothetical protein